MIGDFPDFSKMTDGVNFEAAYSPQGLQRALAAFRALTESSHSTRYVDQGNWWRHSEDLRWKGVAVARSSRLILIDYWDQEEIDHSWPRSITGIVVHHVFGLNCESRGR